MARMSQLDEELKDWVPVVGELVTFRSEEECLESANPDGLGGFNHMLGNDYVMDSVTTVGSYPSKVDYVLKGVGRTAVRRCWLKPANIIGVDPWTV